MQRDESTVDVKEVENESSSLLLKPLEHNRGYSETSYFVPSSSSLLHNRPARHHRRATSISERLGNIGEDMKDAAGSVRNAFRTEMTDAKEGRIMFLDTGMTRSLSVLPEDMEELLGDAMGEYFMSERRRRQQQQQFQHQLLLSQESEDEDEGFTKPVSFSLGPYLALLGAVLAVSSNGPSLAILSGVAPPMIQYWRMVATATALSIFAIPDFYKNGLPSLSFGHWTTMGLAVTCYVFQNLFFTMAITYTSVSNVVVFANSQAVLLLAGKALTGANVSWMEGIGAIVAFSGAILCASDDPSATHRNGTPEGGPKDGLSMIGDLFAICSALFGVGYLTFAKAVRSSSMGVIPFTFIMMLCGSFMVLVFMAITDVHFTLSTHPDHGLFGWLTPRLDRIGIELWIVLVVNCTGTMGFVRAMAHFEPVIIAVATLLEPMCATLIAFAIHVGYLPGVKGWIGNMVVAIGTMAVVYPSAGKGGGAGH